jgi:hypothetical protein
MRRGIGLAIVLTWSLGVFGCASTHPPGRMDQYLGAPASDSSAVLLPDERPVRASLLVVNDGSGPESAPALPDEVRERVAAQLKEEINRGFPIVIDNVLPAPMSVTAGGMTDLITFGKRQGLRYLLVAILSSEEQEYPISVFLGWTTHRQPGFRRDNWSLAEAALLDIESGQVLLRADGRAWATLDSPTAPGINQWYPVIYLRPQDPERRIWPPTYEGAPMTLRLVSMTQAAKRLALNMQQAWIDKRDIEIARARQE